MNGLLYDLVMAPLERLGFGGRRRELLSGLRGSILELGTGTGLNLPAYPERTWVVATDPQRSLLRRARRRRRSGQRLVCARAEELPFRDGSFDAVIATLVFCTVAEPGSGLGEAARVLKREGELRLIEHVRWKRRRALARLQDWLTPAWRRVADGCHLNRDTESLVSGAGFRVTHRREDIDGLLLEIRARPSVSSQRV